MELTERIAAFESLGRHLPDPERMGPAITAAAMANIWFTPREIRRALDTWSGLLSKENLEQWVARYPELDNDKPSDILVVTAGNIPLAGFHDYLSVLITGNRFTGQLSSRDNLLLPAINCMLSEIEPDFAGLVSFDPEPFQVFDAVIATGSNNTSRYFRRQYAHLPHIIRHNRNSVAILDGNESFGELEALASDLLEYYGLGCRSISQVIAPAGYKYDQLVRAVSGYRDMDPNQAFENNLIFQRARLTVLNQPFTDSVHILLAQGDNLHSPIGTVYMTHYDHARDIRQYLDLHAGEIQCIAGKAPDGCPSVRFGTTQQPELWDYADGMDTIDFLINLTNK
jgi:hypothetical protein